MGTPIIEGMLPLIRSTDVPRFSPLTGAGPARPADMRNVLDVPTGCPEETERLVEHLATRGRNASRFVELAMIGRGGRFIR